MRLSLKGTQVRALIDTIYDQLVVGQYHIDHPDASWMRQIIDMHEGLDLLETNKGAGVSKDFWNLLVDYNAWGPGVPNPYNAQRAAEAGIRKVTSGWPAANAVAKGTKYESNRLYTEVAIIDICDDCAMIRNPLTGKPNKVKFKIKVSREGFRSCWINSPNAAVVKLLGFRPIADTILEATL